MGDDCCAFRGVSRDESPEDRAGGALCRHGANLTVLIADADHSSLAYGSAPSVKLLIGVLVHFFAADTFTVTGSEPLAGLHQSQIHQLLALPVERDRVVPPKALDIEPRAGVRAQRLGRAE